MGSRLPKSATVCYKPSLKVDDPSHSILYLSSGTLSQNKVSILLKPEKCRTGKTYVEREVFVR